MITPEQLNQICPALKGAYAASIARVISKVAPLYNMDSPDILEDFIPNLLVECREFTRFEENMNYSAERLLTVWPTRFNTYAFAKYYEHNPQKLANYVYGGRLGNNSLTDGWPMRGSGPIQLTGKDIIEQFTSFYNNKFGTNYNPYEMAVMLRDKVNIEVGMHSACWFFSIAKKLIPVAITDDFNGVVKRITGAYTGLDQRTKYYLRAKVALN